MISGAQACKLTTLSLLDLLDVPTGSSSGADLLSHSGGRCGSLLPTWPSRSP